MSIMQAAQHLREIETTITALQAEAAGLREKILAGVETTVTIEGLGKFTRVAGGMRASVGYKGALDLFREKAVTKFPEHKNLFLAFSQQAIAANTTEKESEPSLRVTWEKP